MSLDPLGKRSPSDFTSQEDKLKPANICEKFHSQRHDLEEKTEFSAMYTKWKRKNNISLSLNHKGNVATSKQKH